MSFLTQSEDPVACFPLQIRRGRNGRQADHVLRRGVRRQLRQRRWRRAARGGVNRGGQSPAARGHDVCLRRAYTQNHGRYF